MNEPKHFKSQIFEIEVEHDLSFEHVLEVISEKYDVEILRKDGICPLVRITKKEEK